MKRNKCVLVTGIGGVVGQGIIRNIRRVDPAITILGTNVVSFSAGSHLVDDFALVPYAYDSGYIERMVEIAQAKGVDLVVPSTDFESFYLSQRRAEFPCAVASSGAKATEIYLDKYLSAQHHAQHNMPFARSFLPSRYAGEFAEVVVKPRTGRGSRNIYVNPSNINRFDDAEYVVQERLLGTEITTGFYINRSGGLHGFITLERELQHGATNECRVVEDYDAELRPLLEKMASTAPLSGAVNVQSIVSDTGRLVPFEVNCRISGTNSIRSHFGFEDVKYTLQEYLWEAEADVPVIKKGVAIRILLDVIYPDQTGNTALLTRDAQHEVS